MDVLLIRYTNLELIHSWIDFCVNFVQFLLLLLLLLLLFL